jgi:hypothetical protein
MVKVVRQYFFLSNTFTLSFALRSRISSVSLVNYS